MRVACDVNVSARTIKFLNEKGFTVCFKAGAGQPDIEWFNQALDKNADVFISGDLDIARLVAENYDKKLKWVLFPNMKYDEGKANLYILERLQKIKELWGF